MLLLIIFYITSRISAVSSNIIPIPFGHNTAHNVWLATATSLSLKCLDFEKPVDYTKIIFVSDAAPGAAATIFPGSPTSPAVNKFLHHITSQFSTTTSDRVKIPFGASVIFII